MINNNKLISTKLTQYFLCFGHEYKYIETYWYNTKITEKTISKFSEEGGWKRLNKTDFKKMYKYYEKRFNSLQFQVVKEKGL